ncbi:hypothetical protein GCM10018965_079250 [Nonomuraea roseola]
MQGGFLAGEVFELAADLGDGLLSDGPDSSALIQLGHRGDVRSPFACREGALPEAGAVHMVVTAVIGGVVRGARQRLGWSGRAHAAYVGFALS